VTLAAVHHAQRAEAANGPARARLRLPAAALQPSRELRHHGRPQQCNIDVHTHGSCYRDGKQHAAQRGVSVSLGGGTGNFILPKATVDTLEQYTKKITHFAAIS
jgi:hypothetical protein